MLFDITNPFRAAIVIPTEAEHYDVLVAARRVLDKRRFDKDVRIVQAALSHLQPAKKSKLVFTKAGFMFGRSSPEPLRDVDHVWESAELAFGPGSDSVAGELHLKFVGGLVRWQISLLSDTWLVYRRETGARNPHTDKIIRVSEYWIDNNFVSHPVFAKKPTFSDLANKFQRL